MTRAVASGVAKAPADRIEAIDVTRGSAMLLVFLSHFSIQYLVAAGAPHWYAGQVWLTQIATPGFVLVSGMMLGLLRTARGDFRRMRDKLIDRGLFLLIVGRPIIAVAHIALVDDWRLPFIDQVYITDTVGLSLIFGAVIAEWVGEWGRLGLGLAVLATSWTLDVSWAPATWDARLVKELLFGRLRGESLLYNFPLLPWFGWYLLGSSLGAFVARAYAERGAAAAARVAFRAAAIGACGVVVAKGAAVLLKAAHAAGMATLAGRAASMLSVGQKLPPGMTYLCLYGALTAVGVGAALRWGNRVGVAAWPVQAAWRWLAMLGRNSLLAFIFQFYVYYTAVHLLPKPPLWAAAPYFAFTIALLSGLVAICDRLRANRLFTVGFERLASGLRRRRLALPSTAPLPVLSTIGAPPHEQPDHGAVTDRR